MPTTKPKLGEGTTAGKWEKLANEAIADALEWKREAMALRAKAPLLVEAREFIESVVMDLEERYDVDWESGRQPREYPFSGAGQLITQGKVLLAKLEE